MSEEHITRMTLEEALRTKGRTDWERLRNDTSEPELDEEERDLVIDWASARLVMPEAKETISIRLDPDVLEYFRAGGKGYQTRINAVLRAWMEAQKDRGDQAP
jgi:uncharacterized protein (DUF4415 family)